MPAFTVALALSFPGVELSTANVCTPCEFATNTKLEFELTATPVGALPVANGEFVIWVMRPLLVIENEETLSDPLLAT